MIFDTADKIAKMIDHTLLKPDATEKDIKKLCSEAFEHGFYSVCVDQWWVKAAKQYLSGTDVKVVTVAGFPLGMSAVKELEARKAADNGADEIDMVIAIGALKSGKDDDVLDDIKKVAAAGKPVKVILETCLLTEEEIRKACKLSIKAGAVFVKTSTGFSKEGARADIIRIMKSETAGKMKIKASGGIKDLSAFMEMAEAGADRIGTSSGVAIVNEFIKRSKE